MTRDYRSFAHVLVHTSHPENVYLVRRTRDEENLKQLSARLTGEKRVKGVCVGFQLLFDQKKRLELKGLDVFFRMFLYGNVFYASTTWLPTSPSR